MTNFTTIADAINYLASALALTTEGAAWVYENSNCPDWDDDGFTSYDFLTDDALSSIPSEYVG